MVLHSFYKLHIVRDHEQKQPEMIGHNKDKSYFLTVFWNVLDLIPLFSKLNKMNLLIVETKLHI